MLLSCPSFINSTPSTIYVASQHTLNQPRLQQLHHACSIRELVGLPGSPCSASTPACPAVFARSTTFAPPRASSGPGATSDTPADGDAVPSADAEDGELEDGQVPDAGIDVKALQHMLTGTLNGFR